MKSRCAQGDDEQPHPSTDAPRHFAPASLVPHRQRMANADIPLHADAGEEEDAPMQVTGRKTTFKTHYDDTVCATISKTVT